MTVFGLDRHDPGTACRGVASWMGIGRGPGPGIELATARGAGSCWPVRGYAGNQELCRIFIFVLYSSILDLTVLQDIIPDHTMLSGSGLGGLH